MATKWEEVDRVGERCYEIAEVAEGVWKVRSIIAAGEVGKEFASRESATAFVLELCESISHSRE